MGSTGSTDNTGRVGGQKDSSSSWDYDVPSGWKLIAPDFTRIGAQADLVKVRTNVDLVTARALVKGQPVVVDETGRVRSKIEGSNIKGRVLDCVVLDDLSIDYRASRGDAGCTVALTVRIDSPPNPCLPESVIQIKREKYIAPTWQSYSTVEEEWPLPSRRPPEDSPAPSVSIGLTHVCLRGSAGDTGGRAWKGFR